MNFDIAIIGAGPAGSSLAIRLASRGVRVLLAEQKTFPRHKLCGEFISPECLVHFAELKVLDQICAAGGVELRRTAFYSPRGFKAEVESSWFASSSRNALSLSRAEMDQRLLRRARETGVTVLEGAKAIGLLPEGQAVTGVELRAANGALLRVHAPVTIDATGRGRALNRFIPDQSAKSKAQNQRARFVAFKTHLEGARLAPDACEIYVYRGGYGGLSNIEGGIANLCFIVAASALRASGPDADSALREVLMRNTRAAYTMSHARPVTPWLATTLDAYGVRGPVSAPGLIAIGDAAAFIDPFTGSGMLMALECAQLADHVLRNHQDKSGNIADWSSFARALTVNHKQQFGARLRLSGALRHAAFLPGLASALIMLLGTSSGARRLLARGTRSSSSARNIDRPDVAST